MKRARLFAIMAAGGAAFSCPALAQIPGQFPPGAIYGNPGGAQAPPRAALPGDFGIQLASVTTNVPITPTTPIGASGTWTSSCFPATGNDRIDFAATLSQSGTLKINRYLSFTAGTPNVCAIPIPGGPVQQSAGPAIPAIVAAADGAAYRGYTIEITNTTGTPSNVTNSALLQTSSSSTTANPAYTDVFGNQTHPVTPMCNGAQCSMANPLYTSEVASLPAGEFHVGEVGQNQSVIATAVPIAAVPTTYTTGQSIGGKLTLAGMARVSDTAGDAGTSGQIMATVLTFRETAGTSPIDVYYFNADPVTAGTACTNAATFTLNTTDGAKIIGVAHLTDVIVTPGGGGAGSGTTTYQLGGFPMPYTLSNTTTAYACIVSRGSVAVNVGTGGVNLKVNVLRN